MSEAKFVLKEPSSKEPTLIYLIFRFNNQRVKFSTGKKIHPDYWNRKTQRIRETKQVVGYKGLNELLDSMQEEAEGFYTKLQNDGIKPTPDNIRNYLNLRFFKNGETEKRLTLLTFAEELIATSNNRIGTIKQYKLTLNNLKEYAAAKKLPIDFGSIDIEFYNSFVRFLMKKEYSTNTIGNRIKNLKVFMNEAVERGLTNNVQFKNSKFKKPQEASEHVYLAVEEIDAIYNLDLTDNPRLDKVRDLFVIGCYTGLRFSDLVQLKKENLIDNKSKLRVKTEKTGELVVIPLHNYVKQILNKYHGVVPKMISNQKMNNYLKEIGEMANIDSPVLITSTKGGLKHEEKFKKYELVTAHTARRSFATNAYLNDIPSISIMKITGHSTEKAFLTYIKISQEDNANKLINHPFFK